MQRAQEEQLDSVSCPRNRVLRMQEDTGALLHREVPLGAEGPGELSPGHPEGTELLPQPFPDVCKGIHCALCLQLGTVRPPAPPDRHILTIAVQV